MNNDWLKAKVKEELEAYYIIKLDGVISAYEKRMEESNQEAWDIIQNQNQRIQKSKEIEVRLYKEFEQKLLEYKRFVRNTVLGVVDGMLSYDSEREFARRKIDEALGYMGENV